MLTETVSGGFYRRFIDLPVPAPERRGGRAGKRGGVRDPGGRPVRTRALRKKRRREADDRQYYKAHDGAGAAESTPDFLDLVTIRPEWTDIEGTSIYLKAGEQLSLETLLYGMLLESGNDAALAVAATAPGTWRRSWTG
jgi:hypothetical protein